MLNIGLYVRKETCVQAKAESARSRLKIAVNYINLFESMFDLSWFDLVQCDGLASVGIQLARYVHKNYCK